MSPSRRFGRTLVRSLVLSILGSASIGHAQASLFDEYTEHGEYEPQTIETPAYVRRLELETGIPRCGRRALGRSRLDGGLASRARDLSLPCRDVWRKTVRFELGALGGSSPAGGVVGLSLSLGLRLHDRVGVHYLVLGTFHGHRNDWEGAIVGAFLFELAPFHPRFRVALGPSMDFVGGCGSTDGQSDPTCRISATYGVHSRLTAELVELPFGGLTMTADLHLGRRDGEWAKTWLFGMGLRF
ncbi:MAG: hypothetical protein H6721_34130 [Sandaracinus sp.]|nr:hypothetical protein [Sandaracinus sp.]